MAFKKNQAVTGFAFVLLDNTGGAVTSGTTNGFVTGDNGTQTALTNTPVHKGNGQWTVNLTAAETNFDTIGFLFTNTAAVSVHFSVKTVTKLVSELNDFNASTDTVANVTTVSTCTTNSDMRGTDGAAQPTDIVTGGAIATSGGAVLGVTNVVETQSVIDTVKANMTEVLGTTLSEPGLGIFAGNLSTFYGNFGNPTTKIVDNVGGATPTEIWTFATRELTSGNNIVLTKGTGLVGLNDLSFNDMWTNSALPESYAANGIQPTPAQAMYLTMQSINDFAISGVSYTVKGIDGTSTVATYTLDDAITPTSKTRTA